MFERFRRMLGGISLKILLSYLSILLIPLLAVILIYSVSSNALLNYQKEQTQFNLQKTAATIRLRFEELDNITSYINSNPGVNSIINTSKTTRGRRDISLIWNTLTSIPTYRLTNQLISQVYLFLVEAGYVGIPPHGFVLTEQTYAANVNFHGKSYQDLLALAEGGAYNALVYTRDERGQDLLKLRGIPGSSSLIVLRIDIPALESLLSTNDTGPNGATYLLNRDGQLLAFAGNSSFSAGQLQEMARENAPSQRELVNDGKTYLSQVYPLGGLTYVSLVQKEHLLQNISAIRYILVTLCALAFLVGIMVVMVLWNRRKKVVQQVTSTAQRMGILDEGALKSEGLLVQTTVSTLAQEVGSLRDTLDRQQMVLKESVLRNLLQGTFSAYSDMESEVKRAGLQFLAPFYRVVAVLFSHAGMLDGRLLEYRLFLKRFLAQSLQPGYLACDMDNTSFVLILPEETLTNTAERKAAFQKLSQGIARAGWPAPSFAISEAGGGMSDLWEMYEQTQLIGQYFSCFDLHGTYHPGDLPEGKEPLAFPMDRELQLANILQARPREELEAFWRQMTDENLKQPGPGAEQVLALRERVRAVLLHALGACAGEELVDSLAQEIKKARSFAELKACALGCQEALSQAACRGNAQRHEQTRALIQQAIEQNYQDANFTITSLSALTGYSENTLYRMIRNSFGLSFASLLEQYRMEQAMHKLRANVLIRDVASQVGYTSDHSFRRAFKRVMKVTPSQFVEE